MATKRTTVVRRATQRTGGQSVLSTVDWLVTLVIMAIPLVGLVMMFIWAFAGGYNINKRNFCRAALILMAAAIVLSLVFGVLGRALFGSYLRLIQGLG